MISGNFWIFVNVLIFVLILNVSQPVGSSRNLCNSVLNNEDHRIVGGFVTKIEDIPWMVSLQGPSVHRCGGSIIGKTWILTAAHCVRNTAASSKRRFRVGSSYHANGGSIVNVKRIVLHPEYNISRKHNDFALLELVQPLKFTNKIQAVALPNSDIADGTMTLVSGWGKTKNSEESRDKLRAVCVPVVNRERCNKWYDGRITDSMICAGFEQGGKDSCNQDSGGPLVAFAGNNVPQLFGVVSWGSGCAYAESPGVYGRVSSIRSWIREVAGI